MVGKLFMSKAMIIWAIAAMWNGSQAQEMVAKYDEYLLMQNLPQWAQSTIQTMEFSSKYRISLQLNPFFYEEDFDGDKQRDLALFIEAKKSGMKGILILNGKKKSMTVLGAGIGFANAGDNFDWINVWRPDRKFKLLPNSKPPVPTGVSLWVERFESGSGVIYWNGTEYHWFQEGD